MEFPVGAIHIGPLQARPFTWPQARVCHHEKIEGVPGRALRLGSLAKGVALFVGHRSDTLLALGWAHSARQFPRPEAVDRVGV
jgi:hypothetical protein